MLAWIHSLSHKIKQKTIVKKETFLFTLFLCLLSIALLYPTWIFAVTPQFQDYAKVVSSDMTPQLEKLLNEIQTKKDLHIEEVILPNLGGNSDSVVSHHFVEQMNQNAPNYDKKVLILIVLESQEVQIFPSQNLDTILNKAKLADIIHNINSVMQTRNYNEMARVGIAGVYHYFQESKASLEKPKKPSSILLQLGIVAALLIIVVGIIQFNARKNTPQ